MSINENILKQEEKIMLTLRELYHKSGYSPFKMSRFEEYDLYAKNKDFLVSGDVLTFTDLSGKLLALKPDVTLSIIKNYKPSDSLYKVYYNENVYRPDKGTHEFKEIMQSGIECIGDLCENDEYEVISLAVKSLEKISESYILDISSVGILTGLFKSADIGEELKSEIAVLLQEKNSHGIRRLSEENRLSGIICDILVSLCNISGRADECIGEIEKLCINSDMRESFEYLKKITEKLAENGLAEKVMLDFSIVSDINYYNGIVFRGYVGELSKSVLSGGRYDNLLENMGKKGNAVGFAVYSDMFERMELSDNQTADGFVNIALPKGRLGEKALEVFEKAGYGCQSIHENNRKLIFENTEKKIRFFWVKPSDVAIYVERGAADIGIAGKDIIAEYSPEVYELCDLGMGVCRMAVAGMKNFVDDRDKTLRVATKFPNIARRYYSSLSRDIDIIKLNGSIEIAPILGLSDVIVDIVETGTTLKENGLEPFETVLPISARLISNKVSHKFKNEMITRINEAIKDNL